MEEEKQNPIEVTVMKRKYVYSDVKNLKTWRDDLGIVVPTFIHENLRKQAIQDGAKESDFESGGIVFAAALNEKEGPKDEGAFPSPKVVVKKDRYNPFDKN